MDQIQSLAAGGVVLLLALAPGAFFVWGLQTAEGFSREPVEVNTLSIVSVVALVAVGIHACFAALFVLTGNEDIAKSMVAFIGASSDGRSPEGLTDAAMLRGIVLSTTYLPASVALGFVGGRQVGELLASQGSSLLGRHAWVLPLVKRDRITRTHIMTNVDSQHGRVMYRGYLEQFALKRDGTFAYLVLSFVEKGVFDRTSLQTTRWQPVHVFAPAPGRTEKQLLAIEGEDVANVVFEPPVEIRNAEIAMRVIERRIRLRYAIQQLAELGKDA